MKHYKNDPELNAEINDIVATELAALRAEVERLRELLCKAAGQLAENSCNIPLIDEIVREVNNAKEALK